MSEFKVGDRVSGTDCTGGIFKDRKITRITSHSPYEIETDNGIWCAAKKIKPLAPSFTPGMEVTGEDIKRALEDGWVVAPGGQSKYERWLEGETIHCLNDGKQNTIAMGALLEARCTYTLLRRKDEPKPSFRVGNPKGTHRSMMCMDEPKLSGRTPERPFLPGDVIERDDRGRRTFKELKTCNSLTCLEREKCIGEIITEKEGAWCGVFGGLTWKLVTPVEEKDTSQYTPEIINALLQAKMDDLRYPELTMSGKAWSLKEMKLTPPEIKERYGIEIPLNQGAKMDPKEIKKPTNALESKGCAEAREETVKAAVEKEKKTYLHGMNSWIILETDIRAMRKRADEKQKEADELGKKLEITDAIAKQILG